MVIAISFLNKMFFRCSIQFFYTYTINYSQMNFDSIQFYFFYNVMEALCLNNLIIGDLFDHYRINSKQDYTSTIISNFIKLFLSSTY